jgi:hypothetical protein
MAAALEALGVIGVTQVVLANPKKTYGAQVAAAVLADILVLAVRELVAALGLLAQVAALVAAAVVSSVNILRLVV